MTVMTETVVCTQASSVCDDSVITAASPCSFVDGRPKLELLQASCTSSSCHRRALGPRLYKSMHVRLTLPTGDLLASAL